MSHDDRDVCSDGAGATDRDGPAFEGRPQPRMESDTYHEDCGILRRLKGKQAQAAHLVLTSMMSHPDLEFISMRKEEGKPHSQLLVFACHMIQHECQVRIDPAKRMVFACKYSAAGYLQNVQYPWGVVARDPWATAKDALEKIRDGLANAEAADREAATAQPPPLEKPAPEGEDSALDEDGPELA